MGRRLGFTFFHRVVAQAVIRLWERRYPAKMPPFHAIDYASRLRHLEELLLISGTDDTYVTPSMVRPLAAASPLPTDLWEVPGGKHLRVPVIDPEAYCARVTDCFDRAFRRSSEGMTARAVRSASA